MADNIIIDGIIDLIKELREKAKCPFCNANLEVERARAYGGQSSSFVLLCRPCQLGFELQRGKKSKWALTEVGQRYIPPKPEVIH